jgi:hypothetical protein
MKKIMKSGALLTLGAALACTALASGMFSLKRQCKVGDVAVYRINVDMKYEDLTASISLLQREKVTKVDASGNYVIEETASEGKMSARGEVRHMPDSKPVLSHYTASGLLTKIEEDEPDPFAYRKAHLVSFVAADKQVGLGDSWEHVREADEKKGVPASKSKFTVDAEEKVGGVECLRVKFWFKETEGEDPMSSEGTIWVCAKDGSTEKVDAEFQNLPFGEAGVPVAGKFSMKRER